MRATLPAPAHMRPYLTLVLRDRRAKPPTRRQRPGDRLYSALKSPLSAETLNGMTGATLHQDPAAAGGAYERTLKPVLDRALACALLIVAAPLVGVCLLLTRLSSTGPLLYRPRLVGRGGREFRA